MYIPDIVWIIFYIVMIAQIVIWIIWRISCFFKKTCHWKSCPYHQHYFQFGGVGLPERCCKKFPPTDEEIEEHNQMLDRLLDQISKK